MALSKKIVCLCLFLSYLKSANFECLTSDQIVELWSPKRETAYFATRANFDLQALLIFDLRAQKIVDDFYDLRQRPSVIKTSSVLSTNNESDDDDPFDCNQLAIASPKPISKVQQAISFIKFLGSKLIEF